MSTTTATDQTTITIANRGVLAPFVYANDVDTAHNLSEWMRLALDFATMANPYVITHGDMQWSFSRFASGQHDVCLRNLSLSGVDAVRLPRTSEVRAVIEWLAGR